MVKGYLLSYQVKNLWCWTSIFYSQKILFEKSIFSFAQLLYGFLCSFHISILGLLALVQCTALLVAIYAVAQVLML